jgi:hypothetical protein
MTRTKKKTDESNQNTAMAVGDTATTEGIAPTTNEEPAKMDPSASAGAATNKAGGDAGIDPYGYRAIVTCSRKGFEMGENRRFNQRVFTFAEKPAPEILGKLKSLGYVYRGAEKAWTVQASAVTRLEADRLAAELSGQSLETESDGVSNAR